MNPEVLQSCRQELLADLRMIQDAVAALDVVLGRRPPAVPFMEEPQPVSILPPIKAPAASTRPRVIKPAADRQAARKANTPGQYKVIARDERLRVMLDKMEGPFRLTEFAKKNKCSPGRAHSLLAAGITLGWVTTSGERLEKRYHRVPSNAVIPPGEPVTIAQRVADLRARPAAPVVDTTLPPVLGRGTPVHHALRACRAELRGDWTRDEAQTIIERRWPHLLSKHAEAPLGGVLSQLVEWYEVKRTREPKGVQHPATYQWV